MKQLLFTALFLSIAITITAQDNKSSRQIRKEEKRKRIDALIKQEEEGVIAYHKQTVYGLKLTNDGYGLFFEIGRAQSVKKSMLFQFEITERKHEKEEKQNNPFGTGVPLIYGKLNFFYPVKLGVQQQILFGNKSNKNGVSISGNFGGGLALGLLRPYELEVDKAGERTFVRYETDTALFTKGPYYGGPNLSRGWKYLKVRPGLYAKTGLRFDYARLNEMVNAIEIGIAGEFYAKKIPQVLYNKERQFFFSAYVALLFGKRK
jgi:hypothetical protein